MTKKQPARIQISVVEVRALIEKTLERFMHSGTQRLALALEENLRPYLQTAAPVSVKGCYSGKLIDLINNYDYTYADLKEIVETVLIAAGVLYVD